MLIQEEVKEIYVWEDVEVPADLLCFTANTAGSTIQLKKSGTPTAVELEVSVNESAWSNYTIGNTITLTNAGDKVYMRNKSATATGFSKGWSDYYGFVMSGSINASGDINYLLCKDSTNSLSDSCYLYLFYNCSSLATAPQLTATTLSKSCYTAMFRGCTNLADAPQLPVTTLYDYCYSYMFFGCTNLTQAPALPAMMAVNECYSYMFKNCTSLQNAPSLPATTLAEKCYLQMFSGCSSLITLPKLPAQRFYTYCYASMFYGCSNIKLSTTKTGAYQTAYRIPESGTGYIGSSTAPLGGMFNSTGGSRTGEPTVETTYYTSNTVV